MSFESIVSIRTLSSSGVILPISLMETKSEVISHQLLQQFRLPFLGTSIIPSFHSLGYVSSSYMAWNTASSSSAVAKGSVLRNSIGTPSIPAALLFFKRRIAVEILMVGFPRRCPLMICGCFVLQDSRMYFARLNFSLGHKHCPHCQR